MIDYARQNMCDFYLPPPTAAPARLDDFNVFKKGPTYNSFYNYDMCPEQEDDTGSVYYNLINFRDHPVDDGWRVKVMDDWNTEETLAWVYDCIVPHGYSELDVPLHKFRIPGRELKARTLEGILELVSHPNVDPEVSRRIAYTIVDKLEYRLNEEMRQSVLRYAESGSYAPNHEQTILNLDYYNDRSRGYTSDYKPNDISLMNTADSGDDHDESFRVDAASPAGSYGSDGSKSGDEDDKKKPFKRPPGRPKGSVKKDKRPRSVSVPQFLRDLLLDERYNPEIIKWEDIMQGKFR